jgi:hypothetical protein
LGVIKRDDAKFESALMISLGNPDDHMYFFHILFPKQFSVILNLAGQYTHLVTASSLPFFAFPSVDKRYARIILDLVARSQLSVVDLLRDKLTQGNRKAV